MYVYVYVQLVATVHSRPRTEPNMYRKDVQNVTRFVHQLVNTLQVCCLYCVGCKHRPQHEYYWLDTYIGYMLGEIINFY